MTNNDRETCRRIRARGAMIILSLALLSLIPACYTILKHPAVIQDDYTRAETRHCSDCHDDSDLWGFHHPHSRYVPRYGYNDPWTYYYDIPWWYDAYWFYDQDRDPDTVPLHQRSLRPGYSKDPISGGRGGEIAPPASTKSGGSSIKTRSKTKDTDSHDKSKTSAGKKRSVRPSKKKKKKDN